jgi:hypothetical protein
MMHCITKSDFIKMTIKTLELYLSIAQQQAEKFGQEASKVICVMDMDNFNIRQYAWRPGKYHTFLTSTSTVHIRIVLLLRQHTNTHVTQKIIKGHQDTEARKSRHRPAFCLNQSTDF